MLSRVASSIYWMSRYIERAENLARFVDVTLNVLLDQPAQIVEHWAPLVMATGDNEWFNKRYGSPTAENVVRFLAFDTEYPNSILTSLATARENARTVRETISSEAWEQINDSYHLVRDAARRGSGEADPDFFATVKQQCHLFNGTLDATMTRGTGWHFANIGRLLERADKTSRILDVKYFTLLPTLQDIGTTTDDLLWSAVLRSVSGFEMYRKRYHTLTIHRIVDFLVLDRWFPRAIRHCVHGAAESLESVAHPEQRSAERRTAVMMGEFDPSEARRKSSRSLADNDGDAARATADSLHGIAPHASQPINAAWRLHDRLARTNVDMIINGGMHEFIDRVQIDLNEIAVAIQEAFFALRPVGSESPERLIPDARDASAGTE